MEKVYVFYLTENFNFSFEVNDFEKTTDVDSVPISIYSVHSVV